MSISKTIIVAIIAAVMLLAVSQAAHVCKNKDCSDIVGDALVKDNLGKAEHFHEKHHDDFAEEARQRRTEINRRERPAQ